MIKRKSMKPWMTRTGLYLAIGAALTIATVAHSSYTYEHASEWFPEVPMHVSDYRRLTIWGWPLNFILDSPLGQKSESIDLKDELYLSCFLADWTLWTAAAAVAGTISESVRSGKNNQS